MMTNSELEKKLDTCLWMQKVCLLMLSVLMAFIFTLLYWRLESALTVSATSPQHCACWVTRDCRLQRLENFPFEGKTFGMNDVDVFFYDLIFTVIYKLAACTEIFIQFLLINLYQIFIISNNKLLLRKHSVWCWFKAPISDVICWSLITTHSQCCFYTISIQ